MSEEYCQSILRIALAQICQSVGWNAAQSTPLELLTDVMGRYMLQLAKVTHRYAEQFGRTDPNLDDMGLAFRNMGVSLSELEEYIRHVEPLPFAHEIVQFPAPKRCNLQIPNPGHKELQTREEHIEDYMPLLYPTPEDEVDNEIDQSQSQAEGFATMTTDQGQTGVGGQAEVTEGSNLTVPGEKRAMTSPLEGSLPKKRLRLTNGALPEEAMHSQYEMKSVAFTNTGDLTPTKGGKLPDARTPPQGFKKTGHDKPSVAKIFTKEKGETRPATPIGRSEKGADNAEVGRAETGGKEQAQTVEEIMIYPDGSSKKVAQQREDEISDTESLSRVSVASTKSKDKIPSSSLQVPSKKKKGRPRSRSKSPRAPKSPGQGKSPAQSGGSPRGRGRPPKDKSLHKTPEKKKEAKNIPVLSTMEEMFASDVLDLSRKPAPAAASKDSLEKKASDADLPLDLSKGKEATPKSARGRGRPPLSPEKKRAREMNIDLCIEAVLKRTCEDGEGEEEAKDAKTEKMSEPADSNQEDTNPAIEDSVDAPPSVTMKKEMIEDTGPLFDLPEQKKKKKEKTQKQKDEVSKDEVRDKLKDKLKAKDYVSEGIKKEPQEIEPPNVYDFPESPPKPPEQIKKEVSLSPQKMFSVEFVDKDVENMEGEKIKEKSKDKERSKEHKEKKKEKKRDKEKKKKNKDKGREREKKKDKDKSKEPGYIPNVSKLKIRIGSSPSSTTVNYMSEGSLKSPPNDSAQSSPRPELKLVIKALPPLSDRGSASPQSRGGSTPRDVEKERKKEKKKEKERKRESKVASPHPSIKQESMEQPLFAPIPSRQQTPFSSSPSKSPTPPPPKKPSPQGLFSPFIKTPTPPPRKTPTPPPPKKTPTPPPPRKSPTPTPPKVPTPVPHRVPTPETDFEPDSDHETEVMREEEMQRFTPSPASTRKTFTPSPSDSPLRSPSPSPGSVTSYARSKSNSQSPVRTPSPGRSPTPQHSPPPSPTPSPYRASVSPSNTKPSTPGHLTSRSPSPSSPSPSPTPRAIKSEIIPPMPPPSMPGASAAKAGVQRTVIAETVTTFYDESGQKVWICPACKMPDDGSPMIGCDICDDWYHWPCVGVKEEPAEEESWYCSKCMGRSKKPAKRGRGRGRGRGPGRGKKKMM